MFTVSGIPTNLWKRRGQQCLGWFRQWHKSKKKFRLQKSGRAIDLLRFSGSWTCPLDNLFANLETFWLLLFIYIRHIESNLDNTATTKPKSLTKGLYTYVCISGGKKRYFFEKPCVRTKVVITWSRLTGMKLCPALSGSR